MKLIAVTNDQMSNAQLVETILEIEPYIDFVILREKSKTDADVVNVIQQVKAFEFDHTKIIVHGRADIASIAGVSNVQVPGHGLPVPLLKEHFPSLSFGRSVHSIDEAEFAFKAGTDWLLYGHVFQTASKESLPSRGTEELSRMTALFPIPVYAIGGIKPEHILKLHKTGVAGVAVMSSIVGSTPPATAAKAYYEACREIEG